MPSGFETIGWVLTVKNKATTAVDKIVKHMEKRVEEIAYSTGNVSKQFYEWGNKRGKLLKGVANTTGYITSAFEQVFNSLRLESGLAVIKYLPMLRDKFIGAVDAITNFIPNKIKLIKKKWGDFSAFMNKDRTWGELLKGAKGALVKGVTSLATGFTNVSKRAAGFVKSLKTVWKDSERVAKLGRWLEDRGGVVGILLGPFGSLFKLLTPLIDMIAEQLSPAIETFSAIVSTAFGPFGELLEIVAQNLAEAIVPFIKPLASFLELAAVKVGVMIQQLLKGKPEKVMVGVMGIVGKAAPIVMRLMDTVLKAGMEIGGGLFKALEEVGPSLLELAVGLLNAIIPIIPPLTKIAVTLLEKVFIPGLLKIAKWLEAWMPEITAFIEAFAIGLGQLGETLDDFFGPKFKKYISDFKILFIDPLMVYVEKAINYAGKLIDVFRMEGVFEGTKKLVVDFFGFLGDAITKVLKMVGLVKDETAAIAISDTERARALASDAAIQKEVQARLARGESIADLQNKSRVAKPAPKTTVPGILLGHRDQLSEAMKGMADGGIVTRETIARVGEKGKEAVLPLDGEVLGRTFAPMLRDLKFPALEKLVEIAQHLQAVLMNGSVRVTSADVGKTADRDNGNISMAPGMYGGGSW